MSFRCPKGSASRNLHGYALEKISRKQPLEMTVFISRGFLIDFGAQPNPQLVRKKSFCFIVLRKPYFTRAISRLRPSPPIAADPESESVDARDRSNPPPPVYAAHD